MLVKKAKDLKWPFSWAERKPLIEDQVFWVPENYTHPGYYVFPGFDDAAVFGNRKPVRLEICSGNGSWIATKAAEDPDSNWVALERKFDRVQKIWAKGQRNDLNNLFTVCGDAFAAAEHYMLSQSLDEVFINFPDPWPKKRHAKNRIVQESFMVHLRRLMKEGAKLTVVTDDEAYAEQVREVLSQDAGFVNCHPEKGYITELPGYGTSYFEEMWRDMGKTIQYMQYVRKRGE